MILPADSGRVKEKKPGGDSPRVFLSPREEEESLLLPIVSVLTEKFAENDEIHLVFPCFT